MECYMVCSLSVFTEIPVVTSGFEWQTTRLSMTKILTKVFQSLNATVSSCETFMQISNHKIVVFNLADQKFYIHRR